MPVKLVHMHQVRMESVCVLIYSIPKPHVHEMRNNSTCTYCAWMSITLIETSSNTKCTVVLSNYYGS